jgi:hypothetical protein
MSGESPREENIAVENGAAGAVRPYHTENVGDAVVPTAIEQATRQQLIVCRSFGQHELCAASG